MNKDKEEAKKQDPQKDAAPTNAEAQSGAGKLQAEMAELKDKYVRLAAEFDNARKRNERERIEFVKYANEGIITEFLGILDDLERSMQAAKSHQGQDALLKGVDMVLGRMKDMLKRYNVEPIKAVGEKFDPHRHEILMLVESDEHEEGKVIEEFQKGYMLGDKVVRTAKVKVAKPKSPAAGTEQQAEASAGNPDPEAPSP